MLHLDLPAGVKCEALERVETFLEKMAMSPILDTKVQDFEGQLEP